MVKEEILLKLRSAEEETARRVAAAKERAADLIKKARAEADQIVEQSRDEAHRVEERAIAAERARLEKERERILAKGAADEKALRDAYHAKVAQHVDKAVAGFERSV